MQVIEHVSPYRQKVIAPLFKDFGHTIIHRGKQIGKVTPVFFGFFALKTWADGYAEPFLNPRSVSLPSPQRPSLPPLFAPPTPSPPLPPQRQRQAASLSLGLNASLAPLCAAARTQSVGVSRCYSTGSTQACLSFSQFLLWEQRLTPRGSR